MSSKWLCTAAVAAAFSLSLAGCTSPASSPTGPGAATTPKPTPTAGAGPCVADPAAVIARTLPAAATGEMPAATAEALDRAATEGLAQAPAEGAIVAVRSPEGTFIKAYGLADKPSNTPMTAEMYQRVGSVTKTFTGTLILQLVQEGKIALDDPVSKHLDGVPRGDDVTIRMLLNMTSGIASYSLDPEFQRILFSEPTKEWTPDELIAIGLKLPRPFEPGARFDYSNTNTIMLGKIIERRTGMSYTQALQERIFTPLSLTGTSMPGVDGALPDPHPTGLTLQGLPAGDTTPQDATNWNPSWGWSAGAIISTAEDLLTYGRALGTGQGLLHADTQTERLDFPTGPGYGLAAGCIDGWFGHTGELPGYNTTLYYDTRSDTTVTVLVNSDIASGDCTESLTLPDNPKGLPCLDPAVRIFVPVSAALGHEFTPNPKS